MRKLYIATAVITLLLGLIVQMPARLAWQWWGSPGVVLTSPQGTVFDGQARYLGMQSLLLENLHWDAHFWPMLTLRMRYALTAEIDKYPVKTQLTLAPTGSIHLADLQGGLPLAAVAPLMRLPVMPLDGLLAVDMSSAKARGQTLREATGMIEIRNAEWLLMKPNLPLGNLRAEVSTQDDVITAELSSTGDLQIQGQARLHEDGSYEADIRLRGRPEAGQRLDNLLKTLGRPVDGWYRIQTKGNLPG